MVSVLVRASSKACKLCAFCWRPGMERANKSPLEMASCMWQEPRLHFHRVDAPVLNTRTHLALHTQWVRKENTPSLLTKPRQLAKSFPLFIPVLLAAGSKTAGKQECSSPQQQQWGCSWASPEQLSTAAAATSICLHKPMSPGRAARDSTEKFTPPILSRDWRDKNKLLWDSPDSW